MHPPLERLKAFHEGGLNDEELRDTLSHLESCATCVDLLSKFPPLPIERRLHPDSQKQGPNSSQPVESRGQTRQRFAERVLQRHSELLSEFSSLTVHRTGGMGFVVRATRESPNGGVSTTRALKIFAPGYVEMFASEVNPSSLRARFIREYLILREINHPHVVRVHSFREFPETGVCIIEMDWLDGASLFEVAAQKTISEDEARQWTRQLLSALSALHRKGVCHRDVSPGNCFVTTQHTLCLVDLGLVTVPNEDEFTRLTQGVFLGTPRFASPQQKLDAASATSSDDVFSAGATMLWALSDANARQFDGIPDYLFRRISPPLARFFAKMIAVPRESRFVNAIDALAAIPKELPSPAAPSHYFRPLTVSAIAGLLVAFSIWLMPGNSPDPIAPATTESVLLTPATPTQLPLKLDGAVRYFSCRIVPAVGLEWLEISSRGMDNYATLRVFPGEISSAEMEVSKGAGNPPERILRQLDVDPNTPLELRFQIMENMVEVFVDGRRALAAEAQNLSKSSIEVCIQGVPTKIHIPND